MTSTTSTSGTDSRSCQIMSIRSISQVQFGHRQYPQIQVLPCGDWVVMFSWTDDAYFAKSGMLRSKDRGETWKEEGWATDSGVLVQLGGNRVGILDSFYPLDKGGNLFVIQGCYSDDGGRTFGPVQHSIPLTCIGAEVVTLAEMMGTYFMLPCFPWSRFFQANGFAPIGVDWPESAWRVRFGGAGPSSSTVTLWNGRLLSLTYCRSMDGPRLPAGFYMAIALESEDNGRSWRQVGVVPWNESFSGELSTFGNAGFTEAGLVALADGELLTILRAGSGLPMGISRSKDDGRTWSEPETVKVQGMKEPARGVAPVMIKMESGALACVYGRPGIHLIIDETGTGKHWRHALDLLAVERASCTRLGAPSADFQSTENVGVAEVAPGELAITYDLWGWQESSDKPSVRQTIRLARVKVG